MLISLIRIFDSHIPISFKDLVMKNLFLFCLLPFIVFSSCSSDMDPIEPYEQSASRFTSWDLKIDPLQGGLCDSTKFIVSDTRFKQLPGLLCLPFTGSSDIKSVKVTKIELQYDATYKNEHETVLLNYEFGSEQKSLEIYSDSLYTNIVDDTYFNELATQVLVDDESFDFFYINIEICGDELDLRLDGIIRMWVTFDIVYTCSY